MNAIKNWYKCSLLCSLKNSDKQKTVKKTDICRSANQLCACCVQIIEVTPPTLTSANSNCECAVTDFCASVSPCVCVYRLFDHDIQMTTGHSIPNEKVFDFVFFLFVFSLLVFFSSFVLVLSLRWPSHGWIETERDKKGTNIMLAVRTFLVVSHPYRSRMRSNKQVAIRDMIFFMILCQKR